ncbi:hypothetical protein FRC06_011845 [Ceratobasidium sp. 370]|nr:hypothetical protein FRC06_011845 [Ceratobasidium sp. 370]
MTENYSAGRKLRLTFNRAKDAYCFYCEDGGEVIECGSCHRSYCYDKMGDDEKKDDDRSTCLTVPPEMADVRTRLFRCPECLSNDRYCSLDYIINRGSRATRRLSGRSSVVFVLFHLKTNVNQAEALLAQVSAILAVFELHFVTFMQEHEAGLSDQQAQALKDELLPREPYHLAVVFLTEGNPDGGWWTKTDLDVGGRAQADEKQFLRYHLKPLTSLARYAASARVFVSACAVNLFADKTLGTIFDTMEKRPWHSFVMPTMPALSQPLFLSILPELFAQLYYFGSPFRSTLLRTWVKSGDARAHTGLIVMQRARLGDTLSVSRFEHAPSTSRPVGFDLPMIPSLCGCWNKDNLWDCRHVSFKFGEQFYFLRTSCCSFELHVAIYKGPRKLLDAYGTTIMEEPWHEETKNFAWDPSRMVRMKISPSRILDKHAQRPTHDEPWTAAGRDHAASASRV